MKNTEAIEKLVREELERSNEGEQYIGDACDGIRFLNHLLFLMTDGEEGKVSVCLSKRIN